MEIVNEMFDKKYQKDMLPIGIHVAYPLRYKSFNPLVCMKDCGYNIFRNRLCVTRYYLTNVYLMEFYSKLHFIIASSAFKVAAKVDDAKAKAQKFLEDQLDTLTDVYDLAIVSYALQLAGSLKAQSAWDKLDQKAQTNGKIHEGTYMCNWFSIYTCILPRQITLNHEEHWVEIH